uniref:F-ATPase gamma subunit n=1 Tax=Alexandrium andersonii TaxID=327968 RepID=A0A7S2ADV5_9DINO|mmetsp:Transcript_102947/g.231181  ORF Transcript_102947/g.231181 Transcript_102947/m.231181 type:complete len:437 (+) Transcript_102947:68-1378(+)
MTNAPQQRRPTLAAALFAGGVLALCARYMHGPNTEGFVGSSASTGSRRQMSRVPRGPVDKVMKDRIESVKKTGKLTDAMRLVAAAKVRRAQDGVQKARPFSNELTSMIKGLVKKLKGSGLEAELPMLRVPDKVKSIGILMVTANRGLCGAYNTFIMKKTAARIAALNKEGIKVKLFIVGRKGESGTRTRLNKVEFDYDGKFFSMPDTITAKSANEIGDAIRNLFLSGEVDKVELVYAKFFTLLSNKPTIRTVLPLSPMGIEDPDDETFTMTSEDGKLKVEKEKAPKAKAKDIEPDVIFDQPPETILNSMLPLYLNSQILSVLYDAQASELSARMTAMKAATDNAADLVTKLTSIFNKKRQAAITQEICEISAGALCLEEKKGGAGGPDLGMFDNEENIESDFLKELEDGSVPDMPTNPDEMPEVPPLVMDSYGSIE